MAIKDTVKKLVEKTLSIGTPPEKKVLYKKVIKRKVPEESAENHFVTNIKDAVKNIFAPKEKDVESSISTPASKKATTKKTSTKKPAVKKTIVKKPAAKKTTTKTASTKKPAVKKTTAKKTTTDTTAAKTKTTKTTSTKKPAVKKPTAKKSPAKKVTAATTAEKTTAKSTPTKKTTTTTKAVEKKPMAKKKVATKTTTKAPAKKSAAPKASKRDEKIALYIKDIKKHYGEVDEDFVAIIVKNLGPSIYRKDAELVSCSDPKELDTVRRNFLTKKLGIDASKGVLDAAIQDVCEELKGVRTKYRATFYYSLAKKFKKESVLN